jgi:hypothetical protein
MHLFFHFLSYFSFRSLVTKLDLRCIYGCSDNTDSDCPVIAANGFNTVDVPTLSSEGGKRAASETLCSLEYRMMNKVQTLDNP